MYRFAFAFLIICFYASAAAAGTTQNPQDVTRAVEQAAQTLLPPGGQMSVGTVNAARYMPACTTPLHVNIGGIAPYEQATVQCTLPRWTLYVQLTIDQSEDIIVAATQLAAGQTITSNDLMLRHLPVQDFAGRQVYTTPVQLEGDQIMMSVSAGTIITQNIVQPPLIVKAGQMVTVSIYSGDVTLSLDAVADQDGRVGDTIFLTNPSSGRRFTAEVTAQGIELHL